MRCVNAPHQIEELIKKSRFIGIVSPCANEAEAFKTLNALQHSHPHASHIVFAYRLLNPEGIHYRFHDAGEPSGTAGKPIYQHLEGKQLINVLLVVIRYFGGVKLGAGGLTRTYSNTASAVIEGASLSDYIPMHSLKLTLDYQDLQAFEYQLKKHDGQILQQEFAEQISILIQLPASAVDHFLHEVKVQLL